MILTLYQENSDVTTQAMRDQLFLLVLKNRYHRSTDKHKDFCIENISAAWVFWFWIK